jgi:hypothetical protein
VIVLAFNLPFVLITKREQYHFLALGASLGLASASDMIVSLVPRRAQLVCAAAIALGGIGCLAPFARTWMADFGPCASKTLYTDAIVDEWAVVPLEVHEWLRAKARACERRDQVTPMIDAIPSATWATGVSVDETGGLYQWTTDRAVVFASRRERSLIVALRQPHFQRTGPVNVRLSNSTGVVDVVLKNADWFYQSISVERTPWGFLRRMERIDVSVSPTFVPSRMDPTSVDDRSLGVQIKTVTMGRQ